MFTPVSSFPTTTPSILYHSPPPPLASHPILPPEQAASLIEKCRTLHHLRESHAAVLRSGLQHHRIVNFKLQAAYTSLGHLDRSLALFRLTPYPNIYLWTATIHAHAIHGHHRTALLLLSQMISDGPTPNAFTLSSALKACTIDLGLGRAVHAHSIKLTLVSDPYVGTALIDMYARDGEIISARVLFDAMLAKSLVSFTAMITCYTKLGDLQNARQLFDEMTKRDNVCWNTVIDGYAKHGHPGEALGLFRQMLRSPVKPDAVTLVSVLSAVAQEGSLESGKWVHSYIENNRIQFSAKVGTALIDMYCKCGSLSDACLVFDAIKDKDVVAWNSMIAGYAMHGQSHEALMLFARLCSLGLQPTDITFIAVLNACSHGGLVREGRVLFSSMETEYGIEPKIEHYGCMVDLLGRAGLVEEAYEFVQGMRIKPDAVLWGSLLGACRLHKRKDLGKRIADLLMENRIANSGTYILLSNIYAEVGNWEEVARVRTLMKDSGVMKEPGGSSIEVDSKVYEFVVGDLSHPKSQEIYAMLEELSPLLKAHGYIPQTELVLHDLEEPEKERALGVHSEKLAIAFGLISTRPGSAIKIMKNLRVCADCHTVTKLLSKITGRKIIVRDRNRFHQFIDGSCSCGDYW